MNYSSVSNPVWADAQHTCINCTVDFEQYGPLPFTAHPQDVEDHGREIFTRCVAGEFGPVAEYVAPPQSVTIARVRDVTRQLRAPVMTMLDGMQTSAFVKGDTALAQAIEVTKAGMRDITSVDLTPYATESDMRRAVYSAFMALASAAPESARVAFNSIPQPQ